jgi:hypothetical protein
MLKESARVRQISGEPRRRWFSSPTLDLYVWSDEAGAAVGFQLCYGLGSDERALTWTAPDVFSHASIDDGEGRSFRHKGTPIMRSGRGFDAGAVAALFAAENAELPHGIAELVSAKIAEYGRRARKRPR